MPPRLPNWAIGASAAAGVVLTPVLAPAALGIVGFSAAGPVAGTLAAAIQSSIGNVVAGSAFAVAQSIAMGGAIPAGVYAASGVAAGVAGWAASWFGGDEPDPTLIRRQLDSSTDREKLDALRTLTGLMSKDRDVSEYFSQVIKNVTSQVFEIRKLVYIYLVRHAEQRPELSLHSINTFQDDLNDSDPLIQAMALRVLCGISNPALIHKQLDSGSDKEKLGAMKTLIAVRFCIFVSSLTDTLISSCPMAVMFPNILPMSSRMSPPKFSRYESLSTSTF
ncbi:adaptin N terminal region-domain-containing protein [Armillaria luteobubalina]|uniref:Adaptin N terminal region-domain-containing protein n=1 Tax=Armillaria luteobubalina TaxID=153913 RepID=A0AA39USA7_9AGAR|nr:adaptin N terminal region-domain-containing protein [Armillaria luteobubalina]